MNEHSSSWHPSAKDHNPLPVVVTVFAKKDGPIVELNGLGFEGMTVPAL